MLEGSCGTSQSIFAGAIRSNRGPTPKSKTGSRQIQQDHVPREGLRRSDWREHNRRIWIPGPIDSDPKGWKIFDT